MRNRSWSVWAGSLGFGLLAGLGAYLFLDWWAVLVAVAVAVAFVMWVPSDRAVAVGHRDVGTSWWVRMGVAALVVPAISLVSAEVVLLLLVGNLDIEYGLEQAGLPADVVLTVTIGVAAAIAGALVGLVAALRGWQVLGPAVAGLAAGLVVGILAVTTLTLVDMGWLTLPLFVGLVGGASLLTSWRMLRREPTAERAASV